MSSPDKLCLAIAEEEGLTAFTNDKRLRAECAAWDIPVKWGLEIMVGPVRAGQLAPSDAVAVAVSMREANPYFITGGHRGSVSSAGVSREDGQ